MKATPSTPEPTHRESAAAEERGDERATVEMRGWLDAIERARASSSREPARPLIPKS
jgi:hypothetical protein